MPEKIGKYRILERIGRGGMGTIFKAHDPVLNRPVALKVISSEVEVTGELRARFFREAQACARLSHPNIVTVYDMGEDDGRIFIVMELLEGVELRRLIAERTALALEDKLSIMRQVCDGLHYAHQRGIVHRDIKPGNIMRLRNGQVKILDFGIAQIANSAEGLTQTGLIMGTLRYIAPEQVRGRADHRSDIFSVGAVFYEFLSLRPPLRGDNAMHLLEQLRAEDPAPLHLVDPSIPSELSDIVARAMRKDPEERFAHLEQMRIQVEQVQRALAEEARAVTARIRVERDQLRHLHATLAERIGPPKNETPAEIDEPRHLAALQALEVDLAARIEAARLMLTRAEALGPAFQHGSELLQAGRFAEAVAEFEAIVTDMPEHARAADELGRARAESDAQRRRQLAVKLVQEARVALDDRGYTLCLEILKQAEEVSPPAAVAQDIASLRQAAEVALAAQEAAARGRQEAERARDRMVRARSSAQGQAEPQDAPGLWSDAEARAADAHAAFGREAYGEAGQAYDAAATGYRLFEAAAREAQLRERDAERAHEQATRCRNEALAAGAPQYAGDLWNTAEGQAAEAQAAFSERSFERAIGVFEEAAALYRRAEQGAAAVRQEKRERAEEARDRAAEAQQSAAGTDAERHAPAPWKDASAKSAAARIALEGAQYDEARESFDGACMLYREAENEASEAQSRLREEAEQRRCQAMEAQRPNALTADAASPTASDGNGTTLVAEPELVLSEAVPAAVDSGATADTSRDPTGVTGDIPEATAAGNAARVPPAGLEVREAVSPRARRLADDVPGRETGWRWTLWARGIVIVLGVLVAIVMGISYWLPPRMAPGPRGTPQITSAPQPPFSAPAGGSDVTPEPQDRPEPPRVEPARPDAEQPAPGQSRDTTARAQDGEVRKGEAKLPVLPPVKRAEQPVVESRSSDARRHAEQAGVKMASARRAAEQAAASFYAPKLLASAQAKEREAAAAVAQSDYTSAVQLLAEARSEYHAAAQDARREADAERRGAPLKASVEQARAVTGARRQQALTAGAERLARDLLDAAEAKHAAADSLAKRQDFAAAAQAYDEAAERYTEAARRAQAAPR